MHVTGYDKISGRNDEYNYVFCFGQKPLLTDKVAIEITVKEGNFCIDIPFAYDELRLFFEENGITELRGVHYDIISWQ